MSGTSAQQDDDFPRTPTLLGVRIPLVSLIQTLAVAEHLNFRHAAAALGVSQSNVSARIQALEEELGILLFERRARGVRLTEAGRKFVDEIAVGIDHLDYAVGTAGAIAQGERGRIHLGLHSSLTSCFFADLRKQYRVRHPGIDFVVSEGPPTEAIRRVLDGLVDMAIVLGNVETPQCQQRELWAEPFAVAVQDGHHLDYEDGVAWDALATETFLVKHFGAGSPIYRHIVRRIGERGRLPKIRRCEVERDMLMQMVADGEGLALTCVSARTAPVPGVRLLPINAETELATFRAIWSPQNRNPALRNLLDLAEELRQTNRCC